MQRSGKQAAIYWLKLLARAFAIAMLVVAVGTYVFFAPRFFGYSCGHIVLMPYPPDDSFDIPALRGVQKQDVYFDTADGARLNGWFCRKPGSKYVALITHGNAGHIGGRLLLADVLLESGISVLLYDYKGYGRSTGKAKLQTLITDAQAAYKYLADTQRYTAKEIILVGESIGGGVTSDLLAQHPDVAGIMLITPFTSLTRLARKKIPYFNVYPDFLDFDPALDNLEMVRAQHPPLLIAHGEIDNLIPIAESEELFAVATEPKMFMRLKGASHNDYVNKDRDAFKRGGMQYLQAIDAAGATNK